MDASGSVVKSCDRPEGLLECQPVISMQLRKLIEAELQGRRVLLRADFNVPVSDGKVADDTRVRAVLPTLSALLERGARVAVCTHLGRPKGAPDPAYRLDPLVEVLGDHLGRRVTKLDDCVGEAVHRHVRRRDDDVLLLENVRFHPGEEANDPTFAQALAEPFEVFVNDAFGTAHRAHASTVGVTRHLAAFAGLLVEKEVRALEVLRGNPRRPYYIIVGGKKAKDKLGVLTDLLGKADGFLIGGGVAFTFLKAMGLEVGRSVVDEELVDTMRELLDKARKAGTELALPRDFVVAAELGEDVETRVVQADALSSDDMGLDIGPETVQAFAELISQAGSVVWAGPMGAFEFTPFASGTREIARVMVDAHAFTVVGGGETAEAVARLGLAEGFGHLSTGGGATLAFLRGRPMPALEALRAS